ncbi:MAG: PIN domain-containing protein [Azoarcus sp.]|jgi:predicted nucleic acid-binding protein|nr:PIN domain-containing protein [Azoarcus sp.]
MSAAAPFFRLVLDTNTVLALWHFADPALAALAEVVAAGGATLASREDALAELDDVLARDRFGLDAAARARFLADYRARLTACPAPASVGAYELPSCSDRDDQKFLEIARDVGASHLLTRDKALLRLNRHRLLRERFRIVTPERFAAELATGGNVAPAR